MKKVDWLVTSLINSSTNMELKNVFRIDTIKLGAIVRKVQKKRSSKSVGEIISDIDNDGFVLMRFSRDLSLDVQVQQKYRYKRDRLLYQYPKNNEYMKYYDKNNVD